MKEVTRRGFITKASVVGAAAAVGGLASTSAAEATQAKTPAVPDHRLSGSAPEDVVLHIRDQKTSEVALIAGDKEFVFHDRQLVSSVLNKLNKSSKE